LDEIYVVAGLGNPGYRYKNTRHSVGFMVIDALAEKVGVNIRKNKKLKHKAIINEVNIDEKKILLVKPQTYMNASGESIKDIVENYKVPLNNLIILYDDADLPLGKIRIRRSGSAGTHNGMKSVIYHLQAEDFPRIRIGIGKPPPDMDIIDYVLGKFTMDETDVIHESILKAAEAAITIVKEGVDEAMAKFNT
jgi:PTH1 family peptidyl-tRNA hydrolase